MQKNFVEANELAALIEDYLSENLTSWSLGETIDHAGQLRVNEYDTGYFGLFMAKAAHTTASTDEPGVGVNTDTYWLKIWCAAVGPAGATGASGSSISQIFRGRLTGETGKPVMSADVSAITSIFFTPYLGNEIGLYISSVWTIKTFTELSLDISSFAARGIYDIWAYWTGAAVALSSTRWKTVTASNNPAAGSNVTVNVSSTTGIVAGEVVGLTSAAGSERVQVVSIVADTSFVARTLAYSHTTPVIQTNARATALTTQNGVYVKTGATDYRYLGSIRMDGTAGQLSDGVTSCAIVNYYNRLPKVLSKYDTTDTWTYNSATKRYANNSAANSFSFLVPVEYEYSIDAILSVFAGIEAVAYYSSPCLNTVAPTWATDLLPYVILSPAPASQYATTIAKYARSRLPIGDNILYWLEWCQSATTKTISGDDGGSLVSGMKAIYWC